jgi:hypothetical protein
MFVPDENKHSGKPFSPGDTLAFWEYLYKSGLLARVILCMVSSLVFLLLLAYVIGSRFYGASGLFSTPVMGFTFVLLIVMVFVFPSMPRSYRAQFKNKFRPDISREELDGLLVEMTGKSLELMAVMIDAICVLCIAVLATGKYYSLSDNVTLILLAAAAIDVFLISLVVASLGKINLYYLRKTMKEEEIQRYAGIGGYKRIIALLVIVNAVAIVSLYLVW